MKMEPEYYQEYALTAMCLWEAAISPASGDLYPKLNKFIEDNGTCAARDAMARIAEVITEFEPYLPLLFPAFEEYPYDWEVMPLVLRHIDEWPGTDYYHVSTSAIYSGLGKANMELEKQLQAERNGWKK